MNIDVIRNLKIMKTQSIFGVLRMIQHLTFSCIAIFILQSDQDITEILYGSPHLTEIQNCIISKFAINYIIGFFTYGVGRNPSKWGQMGNFLAENFFIKWLESEEECI